MINMNELKKNKMLLIVGVLLLIAGGVYRFFPDTERVFENDTMLQKQLNLEKYRLKVADEKILRKELTAAKRVENTARQMLLQADTPAIAAVEIQKRVQQIAAQQDLEVKGMRFLEPVKNESLELNDYFAVPIQFSIDATIEKVKSLLYDLETSDKLITVQEIRARAKNKGNETVISATLIIWGYMRVKTDSSSMGKLA